MQGSLFTYLERRESTHFYRVEEPEDENERVGPRDFYKKHAIDTF